MKKKLEQNFNTVDVWKIILTQHEWHPGLHLTHEENKILFMKLSSFLGPPEITNDILDCISNDTPLDWKNAVSLIHRALSWEEEHFMARRLNDSLTLMSKMPSNSSGVERPSQRSSARKIRLTNDGEHYSNLILFSPTAFPIMVTNTRSEYENVAVAGARYGKGKIVVVPHEAILSNANFIQGAVEWCGNRRNCPITVDPLTKAWTGMGWQYMDVRRTRRRLPFHVSYVSRDKVTSDIPVYITEGHYEDHADHLMDYVRNGGGLIIGGHAWWWGTNDIDVVDGRKCSLLEHPGNKIISRAGIVFSREGIQQNNIEFTIDKVPALKYSLYYALKACILRPSFFHSFLRLNYFLSIKPFCIYLLIGTEFRDIQLFSDELRHNDYFKIILEYMHEIQKRYEIGYKKCVENKK